MLRECRDGEEHGSEEHEQLDVDKVAVATIEAHSEMDEEGRSQEYVEVEFGAVVVGEEPEEDGQKGDDGDEDEESAVEPTHVP